MSDIGQEEFRVELDGGKYTIVYLVGGGTRWFRHGEPWPVANQEFAHSKVITSMLHRINELETQKPKGDAAEVGQRAAHYGDGIQPWDHIKNVGWGPHFAAGNALKYVRRYKTKNGEDDLKKGRWYYAELIAMVEELTKPDADMGKLILASAALAQLEYMLTTEERALLRQQS